MYKKRKTLAWLVSLCMIVNVLAGLVPSHLTYGQTQNLPITVDANGDDWQVLIEKGLAKKVGEGGVHDISGLQTTTSALYLANDNDYLYYYLDAQVPDWGGNGIYMDLALHIEGQDGVSSTNPWARQFSYENEKLPQLHIVSKAENSNGNYSTLYYKGEEIKSAVTAAVNIQTGYEGKIKLSELGIEDGTTIYPMATLSGNENSHGAFNAVPKANGNELMTNWEDIPNAQSVWGKSYTIWIDSVEDKPEEPEVTIPPYISPEVSENNDVTFRYHSTTDASIYIAGTMNGWQPEDPDWMLVKDESTGIWEKTVRLEDGNYEYKFVVITDEIAWIVDPKNPDTANGNSVVTVGKPNYTSPLVDGQQVTFRYRPDGDPDNIILSGSFNNWETGNNATFLTYNESLQVWEVTKTLEDGIHTYTFVEIKDGVQTTVNDPKNPHEIDGKSSVYVGSIEVISPIIKGNDITFTHKSESNPERVRVAGSFNGWGESTDEMTYKDGVWSITLTIPNGVHQYKFIENDNDWMTDPSNPNTVDGNSVFVISGIVTQSISAQLNVAKSLPTTGIIYDESGKEYSDVQLTYALAEDGVATLEVLDGIYTLTIPDTYTANRIPLQVTAEIDNMVYTTTWDVEVVQKLFTYTINYYRPSGDYTTTDLWLWEDGKEGDVFNYTKDSVVTLDGTAYLFRQCTHVIPSTKLNFITRLNEWVEQDGGNRKVDMPSGQEVVEVWLIEGHEKVYYALDDIDLSPRLTNAFAESKQMLLVTASAPVDDLKSFIVEGTDGSHYTATGQIIDDTLYEVTLNNGEMKPNVAYTVSSAQFKATDVRMRNILNEYYYDGELGGIYKGDETLFRVWAPTATSIDVVLYETAYDVEGIKVAMSPIGSTGAWEAIQTGDLDGKYYLYAMNFPDGTTQMVVDPYARSTSANSKRTAIIDLDATDPTGWDQDIAPSQLTQADAIIYELHVRDMSIDNQIDFQYPGTFKAFTETGLKTPGGHSVGIDHLAELGINTVHLLPSYDFGSIDELTAHDPDFDGRKYNWGYDPQSYNVPEGSYSTDPENPVARVTEFKEMVQALHNAGIRVVMDVVYNHTYNIDNNPFGMIAPDYYYRTHDDSGDYANGSGCGNEVASERPMVRKYIVDSVNYWEEEYNVDGFRFDLMALIDTPTMQEVTNTLHAKDPSLIIYGEPWQAGGSVLPSTMQTVKGSQKGEDFKVFNDEIRGAIKGDSDGSSKGFATGESGKEADIVTGIKGSITTIAQEPIEMINYVTAHDNLNMWDKIIKTQGLEEAEGFLNLQDGELVGGGSVEEAVASATPHHAVDLDNPLANETVKRSLLANGIALTSQGVPFIHAGDEILRTKFGDHNSYKSPDAINQIRWTDKDDFEEVYAYYQGLFALRNEHSAFRMTTASDVNQHLEVLSESDNVVSFVLKDYANNDTWKNIVVIYNGNTESKEVTLPHMADWKVVVNGQRAGVTPIETLIGTTSIEVDGLAMTVLYDEEVDYEPIPTTIHVTQDVVGLELGMEKTLIATVLDQYGRTMNDVDVIWTSNDTQIASVVGGKIVARAIGDTHIVIQAENITKEVMVHVVDKLEAKSIEASVGEEYIYTGLTAQIQTKVVDQFGQLMPQAAVTYTSSTPDVVSVDYTGLLTGISEGMGKITMQSGSATTELVIAVKFYEKRYIVIEYHRPDEDYTDWDVWVWNTGVINDNIAFDHVKDGVAIAYIEIGPTTESIGFIIRKNDWSEKDPDGDRFIRTTSDQVITKVICESGQAEFVTLAPSSKPEIKPSEKEIVFTYRDNVLFKAGTMDTLKGVKVEINNNLYDMIYNDLEERYEYTYKGLEEGKYLYRYHVTDAEGHTEILTDACNLNTENGYSVLTYALLDLTLAAEAYHKRIDYNENNVISLSLEGDVSEVKDIVVNLEAIGGETAQMSTELLELTVGVHNDVTPGIKTLPITVFDSMNNIYETSVSFEVVPRIDQEDFDWDEAIIYFMVTDRFNNGDTSNDDPYGIGYDKTDRGSYQGGDFKGVTAKLDYLKDLGVNTIWITPIVEPIAYDVRYNEDPYLSSYYGYHGYWARDFEELNPHLGTLADLHGLIDAAAEKDIKIMVDVVLNHAGYGMDTAIENAPLNYPTDEDRAKFKGMLRTDVSSDEVVGQLAGLPDFKTEEKAVRDQLVDWQVAWVENLAQTEQGNTISYFRIDTVKHVENETWMALKNELTKVMPEFKLIGEMWGASAENQAGYLDTGMMDSLLDFNFKSLAHALVNGEISNVASKMALRESVIDNTGTVGNFLSSHDENGFLFNLGNNEDKMKVAASLQMVSKGQPVIYYGEELGHSGENNYPYYDNRYTIDWSKNNPSNTLLTHYKKMLDIRGEHSDIFAKGAITFENGTNDDYLIFEKHYEEDSIYVAINPHTIAVDLLKIQTNEKPGTVMEDLYSHTLYTVDETGTVSILLPGNAEGGTVVLAKCEEVPLVQVEKVVANPDSGQVNRGTPVTLTTATEGASIYYTLDGTDPIVTYNEDGSVQESNGMLYDEVVRIYGTTTIKAIAAKDGYLESDVETFSYTARTISISSNSSSPDLSFTYVDTEDIEDLIEAYIGLEKIVIDTFTVSEETGEKKVVLTENALSLIAENIDVLSINFGELEITMPTYIVDQIGEDDYLAITYTAKGYNKNVNDVYSLQPLSNIYDVSIEILDASGELKERLNTDNVLEIVLVLDEVSLKEVDDTRKIVVYYISENDEIVCQGGRVVGDKIHFEIDYLGQYIAGVRDKTFIDTVGHWAEETIGILASREVLVGMSEDTFVPDEKMTRAEVSSLLERLSGKLTSIETMVSRFSDINDTDAWYTEAVKTMEYHQILPAYSSSIFDPNKQATREEVIYMFIQLYELLKGNIVLTEEANFTDMSEVSEWAMESISKAKYIELIVGRPDGSFDPNESITRAEVATLLLKFLGMLGDM